MPIELSRRYPAESGSPRAARVDLARYLTYHGLAHLIPTATLLVSELVTNSLVHATEPIELHATCQCGTLNIEVSDREAAVTAAHREDNGRGLTIVDSLAAQWGVRFNGVGRTTWFELGLA
jgi:anti-sigma regulatory factor (Ser/Thr protein kinase)